MKRRPRLRVALYSLPPELKKLKAELTRLQGEEEQAGLARDYEHAAQKKAERLRIEAEFNAKRNQWESEHRLDEVVDENDIAEVVAQWTGIPVTQMLEAESEKLLHMEERLQERIIGQDDAIHALADAIRRARSGLKDPRRPIGSFIFLGSSGVGKTELAKALAQFLFDDEEALVRVDMSEYHEQHTVSRLFGAPPGYVGFEEGGQLTEAVRRRPYRVVLFDEIEKAHPDVWNALLQILDDGRMTDGQGRVVDFRNTVLIMTSNLGTEFVKKSGSLGFLRKGENGEEDESNEKIEKALKSTFRPEFLNRIDEIIIFSPLKLEDMEKIVDLQMKQIQQRLSEQGLTVDLDAKPPANGWPRKATTRRSARARCTARCRNTSKARSRSGFCAGILRMATRSWRITRKERELHSARENKRPRVNSSTKNTKENLKNTKFYDEITVVNLRSFP